VQSKNMANILFKNAIDVSIAAVCYWLVGYGVCVLVRVSPICTSTPCECMVCCDFKHTHALEYWHGTCACVMQCSIDYACPRRAERSFMFVRRARVLVCVLVWICV
jgi:ammonia channel protein AmtB